MARLPFDRRKEDKTPAKEAADAAKSAAVWLGLIVGAVGLFKTGVDLVTAQNKDLRERVAIETAFYEKRYEYGSKLSDGDLAAKPALVRAHLSAVYGRGQPDLSMGWMLDHLQSDKVRQATAQVCRARRMAAGLYDTTDAFRQMTVERARQYHQIKVGDAAESYAFDINCANALKDERKAVQDGAGPAIEKKPKVDPVPPQVMAAAEKQAQKVAASGGSPRLDCGTADPALHVRNGPGNGWDVDVFWCERGDAAATRSNFQRACNGYNALVAERQVGTPPQTLSRIRLRPLNSAQQSRIIAPQGLEARYDVQSFDEQLFSDQVAAKAWNGSPYKLLAASTPTRWYVSLFACES
jgi:hypothetical protein